MGTDLSVLSESYPIYTNMTGFRKCLNIFAVSNKVSSICAQFSFEVIVSLLLDVLNAISRQCFYMDLCFMTYFMC